MSLPRVYAAINAITAAFAKQGIAKEHISLEDDYAYRSIDDVLNRLSPLLAEHRLCVLPRVLERSVTERQGLTGELLLSVSVRVAYDLVCVEDGSVHTIEVAAEALDASDKGTAKAMQSAYKYAMIQAFSIPISGTEDADSRSPRLKARETPQEPVQGWRQWAADIEEMIRLCESREAIDRVLDSNRSLLTALQRERPELYAWVGEVMTSRRGQLASGNLTQIAVADEAGRCPPAPSATANKRERSPRGTHEGAVRERRRARSTPAAAKPSLTQIAVEADMPVAQIATEDGLQVSQFAAEAEGSVAQSAAGSGLPLSQIAADAPVPLTQIARERAALGVGQTADA